MKLHELGTNRQTERLIKTFESYTGAKVDFNSLGDKKAKGLLENIQSFLTIYRSTPSLHDSESDPRYLRLMMAEQALRSYIEEQGVTTGAVGSAGATGPTSSPVVKDPRSKAIMDKVNRGQTLSPEEQKTFNKLAIAKESANKRIVKESELQQAQVVLAAQDMVDRVQKMMEDISEMQFKDLPALVNSIKNDMGTDQATQFQASASQALTTLLQSCQTGKTELETAQGVLTGQAPVVPGQDGLPGATPADPLAATDPLAGDDTDADLDVDANLDIDADEEGAEDLGRERR